MAATPYLNTGVKKRPASPSKFLGFNMVHKNTFETVTVFHDRNIWNCSNVMVSQGYPCPVKTSSIVILRCLVVHTGTHKIQIDGKEREKKCFSTYSDMGYVLIFVLVYNQIIWIKKLMSLHKKNNIVPLIMRKGERDDWDGEGKGGCLGQGRGDGVWMCHIIIFFNNLVSNCVTSIFSWKMAQFTFKPMNLKKFSPEVYKVYIFWKLIA